MYRVISLIIVGFIACSIKPNSTNINPQSDYHLALDAAISYLFEKTNRSFINCPPDYPRKIMLINPKAYIDIENCFTYQSSNWHYHHSYIDTTSIELAYNIRASKDYFKNICKVRNDTIQLNTNPADYSYPVQFVELNKEKCLNGKVYLFSPLIETANNKYKLWAVSKYYQQDGGGNIFTLLKEKGHYTVVGYSKDAYDHFGCWETDYVKSICK